MEAARMHHIAFMDTVRAALGIPLGAAVAVCVLRSTYQRNR